MQNDTHTATVQNELEAVTIEFAEVMRGYVSPGASSFAEGYANGETAGHALELQVSVRIPDLAAFLQQPEHRGSLSGHVECALLGGVCTVQSGTFRLLADSADRNRKVMHYHMYCMTTKGEPFTFVGEKQVQHDAPFDLWRDTTTLYVNIFHGHVDPDKPALASVWATGIISLGLSDFMRVLRGLKAMDPEGKASMHGLMKFGGFFAGKLWDVYGPSLPPAPGELRQHYARFTTEGVKDAAITVHPFSTADGITLQLTRFKRSSCDDVVIIVHGLTTSSDMFIMPEHKNLVQTLLDEGFGDVWTLDHRGSNRFPYNLTRSRYNLDDLALYDHPAALAELRRHIGPHRRVHVIAHCVGALTMAMSLFGRTVNNVTSMILNSVALHPHVPRWSVPKLAFGPWASDYLLGIEYFNPRWRRQSGWSVGKLLGVGLGWVHKECDSPECHMLSFMWGSGEPALFNHANMAPETHDRLGDLFGGIAVHYYRHVYRMVKNRNTAVKFEPGNPRYAALPDNYMEHVAEVHTPVLLVQGQENRVFADSMIEGHKQLEAVVPGRHQLHVFPGYGHQDVFMGKDVARDIFPRLITFLREHAHD